MFDEAVIAQLDETPEAKEKGRSALLRRLTEEYLRQVREQEIASLYAAAYGSGKGLGSDFEGWEEQGRWPSE
jgi:hypothetical protein